MQNLLNPHPWPANTSEPSELQENTANDANSAPFAPPPGEHHKFHVFRTQQTRKVTHLHISLHIFYMYAHILHYCRPVLDAYNFTIPTVFYIEIYVYFI